MTKMTWIVVDTIQMAIVITKEAIFIPPVMAEKTAIASSLTMATIFYPSAMTMTTSVLGHGTLLKKFSIFSKCKVYHAG